MSCLKVSFKCKVVQINRRFFTQCLGRFEDAKGERSVRSKLKNITILLKQAYRLQIIEGMVTRKSLKMNLSCQCTYCTNNSISLHLIKSNLPNSEPNFQITNITVTAKGFQTYLYLYESFSYFCYIIIS